MLGIQRSALKKKRGTKKIRFKGFSHDGSGNGLEGKEVFNCSCRDGIVRSGVGTLVCKDADGADFLIGVAGAERLYFAKTNGGEGVEDADAVFVIHQGALYVHNSSRPIALKKGTLGNNATYASIKTNSRMIYHMFSGAQGMVYTLDGISFTFMNSQAALDSCAVEGRYFVAISSARILYSPPYRPDLIMTRTEERGELYLPMEGGKIRNLRSWRDYLYIFTEKKIYRLKVAAREREFRLDEVDYTGGEICLNSMITTEAGLLFLAMDGFHFVQGEKTEAFPLRLKIAPCDSSLACRVGRCGSYYMIEYQEAAEGGTTTQRVALDVARKECFFTDPYGGLCGAEFFLSNGILFRFVLDAEADTSYRRMPFFETKTLNLGTDKRKRLKRIRVEGEGSVNMRILYGDKIKLYPLTFSEGVAEVKLDELVREFSIRFTTYPRASVRDVEIEYVTME